MAYQEKEDSGVLFKNDRKEKPGHPDFKGHGNVNGQEVWISGWRKKKKDSEETYLSLSFTPKEARQGGRRKSQQWKEDRSDF